MRKPEIDRSRMHVKRYYITAAQSSIVYLSPGGFLIGVAAEVNGRFSGTVPDHVKLVLSTWPYRKDVLTVMHAEFTIPVGFGFHDGGVLLPEPLEDYNSATPYVVTTENHPDLIITQVSCWLKAS